jgi:hypothetical protein
MLVTYMTAADDLAAAGAAQWRFVAFHHSVFTGNVHNYQRTFPLTFAVKRKSSGAAVGRRGRVASWDKASHNGVGTQLK